MLVCGQARALLADLAQDGVAWVVRACAGSLGQPGAGSLQFIFVAQSRIQGVGKAAQPAKQPGAQSYPTSVSRAAGLAITKALSKEFAADNILVNTVCIGRIKSGQHERRYTKEGISAEKYYAESAKGIPMGRVGEAEEVANVIAFLVSDAASYVTGSSVNLDGGISGVL